MAFHGIYLPVDQALMNLVNQLKPLGRLRYQILKKGTLKKWHLSQIFAFVPSCDL